MFYSTSISVLHINFCSSLAINSVCDCEERNRERQKKTNTWPVTHTTQDLSGNTGLISEENSWNCWRLFFFSLKYNMSGYILESGFLEMSASLSHKQNI